MRPAWIRIARRFGAEEQGASMVEFSIVAILFFFLFFSLIDFGRLGGSVVTAQKAAELAVRMAAVRPAACAGVPDRHGIGSAFPAPSYGTSCRSAGGVCANAGTQSCAGAAGNATASEIFTRIQPMLPPGTAIGDLDFTYSFDSDLGFLGGPYTPMVTVTITPPNFQFISPLGGMANAMAAGTANGLGGATAYGPFSASMPAEDLAQGDAG